MAYKDNMNPIGCDFEIVRVEKSNDSALVTMKPVGGKGEITLTLTDPQQIEWVSSHPNYHLTASFALGQRAFAGNL